MKKNGIFLLFVSLCFSLCFVTARDLLSQTNRGMKIKVHTAAGQEIQLYKGSYALVIGNGNYTNGWDPLDGALTDVGEVMVALEEHGFHVTLKKDLTKAKFDRAFAEFVLESGADANNRLLFYYAGHGYTRKSATGEDLGYLVMVDAPVPERDKVGFELESIPMESLVTQAEKILAQHVLFMFDSCFSGTILNVRDRIIPPESISDRIKYPVRQFITAGRAGEVVPDHSDFKQAFLDLIEGRDHEPFRDGYITGEELGFYLKNQVPIYNPAQHPQYGKIRNPKLDKGDFVFVLPKEAVLPTVATLTVTSIPSGASVYIDSDFIGRTPLRDYKIDTGAQREKQIEVRLELSGYENHVTQLTLRGGQQMPWDVRLEKFIPRTGTLTVTSTPSGADIYVDNAWIGKTPLTSYEVDTGGQHERQVTMGLVLAGYKSRMTQLTLRSGQHTPLDVHLEKFIPRTGMVTVTSTPSGASVYIDGDLIGQTPLSNYEIDTGSQREKQIEVRLELSGYENHVTQLTLKGGQHTPWDVRLEKFIPRIGTLTVTSTPSGASVYIDGVLIGPTPLHDYEIDTGGERKKQVEVGLELLGYRNHMAKITLEGGRQTPWDVRLEKILEIQKATVPSGFAPEGMALIPAGEFQMGTNKGEFDEKPVHTIYVDAFYMDVYEVTNAQYKAFVDANPQWRKDYIPSRYHDGNYLKHWTRNSYGRGDHPVVYVSWYGAMAYAEWAGKRLPTEAEWEKAARGGLLDKKYPWGNSLNSNKAEYRSGGPAAVGTYPPNKYGLYDMVGNVWEWCLDVYDEDFYKMSPRRNPIAGNTSIAQVTNNFTNDKAPRVMRGGAWDSRGRSVLRSADRLPSKPMLTNKNSGFRCVRAVSP